MVVVVNLPQCEHRNEVGVCAIASRLGGREIVPWDNACSRCTSCLVPQAENFVTASLGYYAWILDGDTETGEQLKQEFHKQQLFAVGLPPPCPEFGAGAILHGRLQEMGFEVEADCPCRNWICAMNREGTAWCREHTDEIAVSMVGEYRRRFPLRSALLPNAILKPEAEKLIAAACDEWDATREEVEV